MSSRRTLALLLAWVGLSGGVQAGQPWWWGCWKRPCCPCCLDDYVGKSLPPLPPRPCCGPNDYCGRSLPLVYPVKEFHCDDYQPRPLPTVAPCPPPWYRCR